MKLVLRSLPPCLRLSFTKASFISQHQFSNHKWALLQPCSSTLTHSCQFFSTSKQDNPENESSDKAPSSSNTKDFKLSELKNIFENKMNKYEIKGLLKIYHTLKTNNVPLSSTSLKQLDYRLILEINTIDHPTLNFVLEMCHRNGQYYQPKSNNKLLRGLNLKIQKNRLTLNSEHVFKTLKLLNQMKFPKITISRIIFGLVNNTKDPSKNLIHFINNLNVLRITLMAIEMNELDLEIKRNVLDHLIKLKPKGPLELTYFYSILKTVRQRLDEAVLYEAQRKTVFDLAFNPYGMYEEEEADTNPTQTQAEKTETEAKKASNIKPEAAKEVNPVILERLMKQKEQIVVETLNRIDIRDVSEELYNSLIEAGKEDSDVELGWKDTKQICLLLIGNAFGLEGKERREIVKEMVKKIFNEGLGLEKDKDPKTNQSEIDSNKLIRLPEFIILIQEISSTSQNAIPILSSYLTAYESLYYKFMNLEEKLMFRLHKSKLLNLKVNLEQVKDEITLIEYGLNPEEFGWLNKVLSYQADKHSPKDAETIKEIWKIVEKNLDLELEILQKEKIEKELKEQQEAQHAKQAKEQQKNSSQHSEKSKQQPKSPKESKEQPKSPKNSDETSNSKPETNSNINNPKNNNS